LLRRGIRKQRLIKQKQQRQSSSSSSSSSSPPNWAKEESADTAFFGGFSQKERRTWSYAALLLASKVEETLFSTRKFKSILLEENMHNEALLEPMRFQEQEYLRLLNFDIVSSLPHLHLLRLARVLKDIPEAILNRAFDFVTISIFTTCIYYPPLIVAVTCLFLSARLEEADGKQSSPAVYMDDDDDLNKAQHASDDIFSDSWWIEQFDSFHVNQADVKLITTLLSDALLCLLKSDCRHVRWIATTTIKQSESTLRVRVEKSCPRRLEYTKVEEVNKGTFGTVWKAKSLRTGEVVALKKIHSTYSQSSGFPYYMLREILYLLRFNYKHIIHGHTMVYKRNPSKRHATEGPYTFYIVMEFVSQDLLRVLQSHLKLEAADKSAPPGKYRFDLGQVKSLMVQLLKAVQYMHESNLLHRDIKCANLLLTNDGLLKVADLGSIRDADRRSMVMTVQVVTLWYRPPELLFQSPRYTSAVDIWSIGCLFYELLTYKPLFPGSDEVDTINRIIRAKGAPLPGVWLKCFQGLNLTEDPQVMRYRQKYPQPRQLERILPSKLSNNGVSLFLSMLEWDPEKRISAQQALDHEFFKEAPFARPPIPSTKQ